MADELRQAAGPILRERRLRQRRRAFLRRLDQSSLRDPPKPEHESFFGRAIPDVVELAGSQIGDALIHSIPGLYEMGKAGVNDARDLVMRGDVTPERLGRIAEATVRGTVDDFRHPLRNPGYLLLDLIALGSAGASVAARTARAARVASAVRHGQAKPVFERKPLPPDEGVGRAIQRDPDPEPPFDAPEVRKTTRWDKPKDAMRDFVANPKFEVEHALAKKLGRPVEWRGEIGHIPVDDGSRVTLHRSKQGDFTLTREKGQERELLGDTMGWDEARDLMVGHAYRNQVRHEVDSGVRNPIPSREYDSVRGKEKSQEQIEVERREAAGYKWDGETESWIDIKGKEYNSKTKTWEEPKPEEVTPATAHHVDELDRDLVVQGLLDQDGGVFKTGRVRDRLGITQVEALQLRKSLFDAGIIDAKGKVKVKREKPVEISETDIAAHQQLLTDRQAQLKEMRGEIEALAKEDPDGASDLYDHYLDLEDELKTMRKEGPQPKAAAAAAAPDAAPSPGPSAEGVPTQPATPREGTRKLPREEGTAQRARKVNDRELGINPRALRDAGVPDHVQKPLRAQLKAAMLADASPQKLAKIFRDNLGSEAGKKAYATWKKREMGPLFVDDLNPVATGGDVVREFFRRPQGGSYLLTLARRQRSGTAQGRELKSWLKGNELRQRAEQGTAKLKETKRQEVVPVEITLSNNPMVRAFQLGRYRMMHVRPETFSYPPAQHAVKMLQAVTRTGDKAMEAKIKHQLREFDRIREAVEEAQKLVGMDEEMLARYVAGEEAKQRKAVQSDALSIFDSLNQLAVIGTLYLKPAYITANMIGQLMLVTMDHMLNPVAAYKNWRLSRRVFAQNPEAQAMIKASMHEGIIESFGLQQGRSQRIGKAHRFLSKKFNKILDEPFREASFFNEARRRGWTEENIADLMRPENRGELLQVAARANENIIDYGRLGPNEREYVRRLVFFYPWVKGATRYSARFLTEHPAQAYATIGAGKFAQDEIEKELGPVPSYVLGSFVGPDIDIPGFGNLSKRTLPDGTEVPRIINPAAVTVLGTLGETVGSARALIAGKPRESEQLSEYLTPAASLGISIATRTDPFTGRTFPTDMTTGDIITQEIGQTVAPWDLLKDVQRSEEYASGERPTDNVLFPYNARERIARYFGPTPHSYNPKEGQSRAFSEKRGLESATKREQLKGAESRKQLLEQAKKVGLLPKGSKQLPKELRDALLLKTRRETNLVAVEKELGRELTQLDRLYADLGLAVRMGKIPEAMAKRIIEQAKLAPDPTVAYLARRIREGMFGTQIISRYRKAINGRLALQGEEQIR